MTNEFEIDEIVKTLREFEGSDFMFPEVAKLIVHMYDRIQVLEERNIFSEVLKENPPAINDEDHRNRVSSRPGNRKTLVGCWDTSQDDGTWVMDEHNNVWVLTGDQWIIITSKQKVVWYSNNTTTDTPPPRAEHKSVIVMLTDGSHVTGKASGFSWACYADCGSTIIEYAVIDGVT